MLRTNLIRKAFNVLPKRSGHHHHELTNFTNGPPKKRTVLMAIGLLVGTPILTAGTWYWTYVGSKHFFQN
ncbi:hypothetical protein ABK040_014040 [Willaertia magna]